jgi:hypothetical protein
MGLLMSETMLTDPILDDRIWVRDNLVARVYAMDFLLDVAEFEDTEPTSWPLLLVAPEHAMTSI